MAHEEPHQIEGPEAADVEGGAKVGGKKKLIIIVVAVVVLLAAIGGALFFFGIVGGKPSESSAAESGEHGAEGEKAAGEHGDAKAEGEHGAAASGAPVFYDLPEFLVNLNSTGKQVSFLKMKIAIELEKQDDVAKVEGYMPRVTDAINGYLRELRASDLSGSAGMARLKEELLLRLNKSVDGVKVRNIYIKQILVQ